MIVIIEGIDRVGKTTLANVINKTFKIPIFKQNRIGGNLLMSDNVMTINYGTMLGQINFWNWDNFNDNLILDRFHWTEAVYSLIERNNDKPMQYVQTIESYMARRINKYLIIQVMPTDINWSSMQHGLDLSLHQDKFNELYDKCNLNKCRCTFESYNDVINKIGELI